MRCFLSRWWESEFPVAAVAADIHTDGAFHFVTADGDVVVGEIGGGAGMVGDHADLVAHFQGGGFAFLHLQLAHFLGKAADDEFGMADDAAEAHDGRIAVSNKGSGKVDELREFV